MVPTQPALGTPVGDKVIHLAQSATPKKQQKDNAFKTPHDGTRPALRRLVDLVHKATALFPHLDVGGRVHRSFGFINRERYRRRIDHFMAHKANAVYGSGL